MSTQYTVSWCLLHFLLVPCETWCFQFNFIRIFVFFVHWIHSREEYHLSILAWILSSRYRSWICGGVYTDCTSNMIKCSRRNRSESIHCPVLKDQWIASWMTLNSSEIKNFLSWTSQYNNELFSCGLRLLPFYSSTVHQTNVEIAQDRSEDNSPEFNRSIFSSW